VLISTYELGHQPFGLASPAAWLAREGCDVTVCDLAVSDLAAGAVAAADLVAFYLPMHTATRLAVAVIPEVRRLNPSAHLCAYGLYAPVNAAFLHGLGVATVIGGEFEAPLVRLARDLGEAPAVRSPLPLVSLDRQAFVTPLRTGLPPLERYATLRMPGGAERVVGYVEATRGCKHRCRHCPVVPVYEGRFRVVQPGVVLADVEQQVAAGAEHVTFGDPDFLNGPGHAIGLVRELHARWPALSYDVTIKIEHLVDHADLLPVLRDTGCVLVTSAVEAFDEPTLAAFDKRHTRADILTAVKLLDALGIALNPTFVAFTPWTTLPSYVDLLASVADYGLVGGVAGVQYAIRLLLPEGSHLLGLAEVEAVAGAFDPEGLCYPWTHPDPRVDELQQAVFDVVERGVVAERGRAQVFRDVCATTARFADPALRRRLEQVSVVDDAPAAPHLSEPWFCCAEPVRTRTVPSV
jgi:radical SAM superfamily enzyme YgiQ (UPF0313 family)